jgi:hypothetical protein
VDDQCDHVWAPVMASDLGLSFTSHFIRCREHLNVREMQVKVSIIYLLVTVNCLTLLYVLVCCHNQFESAKRVMFMGHALS